MDHRYVRRDSLELHVLAALAAGDTTASEVAARLGETAAGVPGAQGVQGVQAVQGVLDWSVGAGVATCLGTSYSLTPRGLEIVGVAQGVDGAVDASGHVDLAAAARLVSEQYAGAREAATDEAVRQQAGWVVDEQARERVVSELSRAYAQGALSKEQLDERAGRALAARTMGELREAGAGVVEVPPAQPGGLTVTGGGLRIDHVELNPALARVRWSRLLLACFAGVLGLLVALTGHLLPGLALVAVAAGAALWVLRPLLGTGTTTVNGRPREPGNPPWAGRRLDD